jgi:hypothetical protein
MVSASDAALFYPSIRERSASVRTAVSEQAQSAAFVTKQHQVFAQHPNKFGGMLVGQFFCDGDWVPIAT